MLLSCAPAIGDCQTLTLDDAVKTAEANNRPVLASQLSRKKATQELFIARTNRLPIFSVTPLGSQPFSHLGLTEKGALGIHPTVGPIPGRTTTLKNSLGPAEIFFTSISEPLSQHYKIGLGIQLASALDAVWLMDTPMGFTVILGITSLIGIIVSRVIVLFDFIEERHAPGAALRNSLIDAGILRIRPVLITVGATMLALFPLAIHGGPLWQALCYAQMGGLTVATTVTLFIVPVFYSIFVLGLKIIRWEEPVAIANGSTTAAAPRVETRAGVASA